MQVLRSATRIACLIGLSSAALAQLTVTGHVPTLHASNVAVNTTITVDFDRPLAPATLSSFHVYAMHGGPAAGAPVLENGGTRIAFRPTRPFFAGEVVMVAMSNQLQASDGSFLRSAGYVFTFRTRTAPAGMSWVEIQSFFTQPGSFTRIYGGQTCDLDGDDYLDMQIVSQVSSDVRVFKNLGDATGLFDANPHSVNGVGSTPSPNENADFNGDGRIDIVTCNSGAGSVSILLGNGDGTFQPAVSYSMGSDPRGLAVLDCDGDGDIDVFTTNYGSGNIARRLNNGNGTLGTVSTFDGGGSGERALTAADMDGDGIQDLVVGLRTSELVAVHRCNGNGTFTQVSSHSAGGGVWMIVCGDVNGDGNVDVSCANGLTGNGAILRGNGNGTLQAPQTVSSGFQTFATDLGDLDGDGDLDWVLSSFGARLWRVFRNDSGTMNLAHTFTTPANPACAALFDIDNDQDLDIVLLTETSDEIRVVENDALNTDTFCYGTNASCPCANGGLPRHGCDHSFATGGALLNAQGMARVVADTLALNAGGLPPSTAALFFQGTTQQNGGSGSPFGDGLRCAAGAVIRLGTRFCTNGWTSFGSGNPGDPAISVQGAIPAAGGTRYYQAWYRNTASFCTSDGFNLSNGVRVTWSP